MQKKELKNDVKKSQQEQLFANAFSDVSAKLSSAQQQHQH